MKRTFSIEKGMQPGNNVKNDNRVRIRCDTEKAKKIGSTDEGLITLYRNKAGVFFLHIVQKCDGAQLLEENLKLISVAEAKEWCKDNLSDKAFYEHIFANTDFQEIEGKIKDNDKDKDKDNDKNSTGEIITRDLAPFTKKCTFTLPEGLVERVRSAAIDNHVNKSQIVEEALIQYFAQKERSK